MPAAPLFIPLKNFNGQCCDPGALSVKVLKDEVPKTIFGLRRARLPHNLSLQGGDLWTEIIHLPLLWRPFVRSAMRDAFWSARSRMAGLRRFCIPGVKKAFIWLKPYIIPTGSNTH